MKKRKKSSLLSIFSKQLKVSQKQHNVFLALVMAMGTLLVGGSNLQAKPVGQFYWTLPYVRLNSDSNVENTSLGTGFYVAAGDTARPAHLADIGLNSFDRGLTNNMPNLNRGLLNEFTLGYAYHWSSNYDAKKDSHNVHVGIGRITGSQSETTSSDSMTSGSMTVTDTDNVAGLYFRIAYFRALARESSKRPLLIGVNFQFKQYSSGTETVTETFSNSALSIFSISAPTTLPNPAVYNSMDFSLIIGTSF